MLAEKPNILAKTSDIFLPIMFPAGHWLTPVIGTNAILGTNRPFDH